MNRLRPRQRTYQQYAAGILTEVALTIVIFMAAFAIIWALEWLTG